MAHLTLFHVALAGRATGLDQQCHQLHPATQNRNLKNSEIKDFQLAVLALASLKLSLRPCRLSREAAGGAPASTS